MSNQDSADDAGSNESTYAERLAHEESRGRVGIGEVYRFATSFDTATTIVGAIAAICAGAATPTFMYFYGRMTTYAYGAVDKSTSAVTTNFAFIMTCIGAFTLVMTFIHSCAFIIAASRQTARLKAAYFAAILQQDMGWHDVHKPGELISRLYGDTRVFQNGINDRLGAGLSNVGTGFVGFALAFVSCWELALVFVCALPIVMLVMVVTSRAASKYVMLTREHYAVAGSIATEVMENIKTVQTFNRESHEADRFAEAVLSSREYGIKKEMMMGMTTGATFGIMFCVFGCAFIFSSYLVQWGRADVGKVSASFLSVLYGATGLGGMFPAWMGLMEARTAAFPIYQTINRQPAIDIDEEGEDFTFDDCIEFNDVSFSYPTRPDQRVFEHLSVTIEKGKKIAFSGATGCGKSTILALIQRFYDPLDGAVFVDGHDLRDISVKRWRRMISIVSQEPSLFSGSVLDNVRIGKANATEEEVILACKRARIHDTIMTLPQRYQTPIGSVGGQLSGGQKQRLAIARAIVRRSTILLLDEATSALDRKSEVEVQMALDDLTLNSNMTVITIAHRLATIKRMDCIYFLDNDGGQGGSSIVEHGTFDELLRMNGRFASMTMMQDQSCGDLRTVVHNTSFYLYPASAEAKVSKEDVASMAAPAQENLVVAEEDNWSQITNEYDVPFSKRTGWEMKHTKVSMWRIMKLTKNRCWAIWLGFFGSILSALAIPCCGLLVSQVIGVLGQYESDVKPDPKHLQNKVNKISPFLFLLAIVAFFAFVLIGFYGLVGEHLTYYLRTTLFHQILRQDATFFDLPGRDPGALGAILSGECEAVHQLYGPALGSRLKSFFSLVGGLVIGFLFQWKITLVSLSTMPLLVGGIVAQQVAFVANNQRNTKSLDSIVNESITSIRTVSAFNMKDRMVLQYKRALNEDEALIEKRYAAISFIIGVTEFVAIGSVALAYWYGGQLIDKGEANFTDVFIAVMAVFMGSTFAGAEAGGFASKVRDATRAARSVFSIIDRVPDVDPYEYGAMDLGEGCAVNFGNVGFRYPARSQVQVLEGLNINFKDGSSNGLMGQTGCGKSTIVQMLARFYLPTEGVIWMNGKDLTTLDTVTWRDNISIVLQEPNLFSGSIRENIKYSLPDATDDEMYEAAKIACVHEEILKMDDGYDTQVGYRGRELSGGQKQRVAIARGVLRCPKLLLLDEATSALDNVTEAAVQLNINAYQRRFGVTIVSIAHRLTTIQHSDQIVLLDSGKIIEQGTHEELMSKNGEYRVRWELTQQ